MSDEETKLLIKELSNARTNSSFSSGYTFFNKLTAEEKELISKPCSTPIRMESRIRNSFTKRIMDCTQLVTEFELDFMSLDELMEVLIKVNEIEELEKEISGIVEKCLNEAVANSVEIIES